MLPQPGMSIREQFLAVPGGGIVYDAVRLRKPDAAMFRREYWHDRGALDDFAGGRGSVSVLHSQEGDWILRHYRRGGFAARVSADRYVWMGEDATRSFREWRLLAQLHGEGLPVPAPIAANYERSTVTYRANIITARLENTRTLATTIASEALSAQRWQLIGRTIARFHSKGVHHADLNANNILLRGDEVFVLDFDRGRIRPRGAWEGEVLARLQRSLLKISRMQTGVHYSDGDWRALLAGVGT